MRSPLSETRTSATNISLTFAFLVAANVAAWTWAWISFHEQPVLLGTAFLAYTFGLRHAFDADHIAAIDNVVRKLMQEKRDAHAVGFYFSLGHSTVVIVATAVIAAVASGMGADLTQIRDASGFYGTLLSALFLLLIGLANLIVLKRVIAIFARVRSGGSLVDQDIDELMKGRGLLARVFRPIFGVVSRPWHMYPVGFLFGLGFDTATEIGLLGISATQAAQGVSFWSIMIFPALFTAAMSLMDTTDSVLMTRVYGWAFVNPMRKLCYNVTLTAVSIAIALVVGGVEVLGLLMDKMKLEGRFWTIISQLNDNFVYVGLSVVGIFLSAWIVSIAIYKLGRFEDIAASLEST
jgi:high-affinity nickel-transport protein